MRNVVFFGVMNFETAREVGIGLFMVLILCSSWCLGRFVELFTSGGGSRWISVLVCPAAVLFIVCFGCMVWSLAPTVFSLMGMGILVGLGYLAGYFRFEGS